MSRVGRAGREPGGRDRSPRKDAPGTFRIEATDGRARAGVLAVAHGTIPTPCFMPVGTQGTVKMLTPEDLEAVGARIVLGNTYHLYLRPGLEVLKESGGLHRFMHWRGPILTDSGGFQVFSLARINRIDDDGVTFQSHIDGSRHRLTPEATVEIQAVLGSDIMMALDQCPPGGADRATAREAVERTLRWLARCRERHVRIAAGDGYVADDGMGLLFPIFQGASFADLRLESAQRTLEMGDWPGVGIGGLSVGEPKDVTLEILDACEPVLPTDLPRYLMGVGYPEDVIEAIRRGVDMFDCVAPTRNGRNGTAFTRTGRLNMKRADLARDFRPVDEECACECCRGYSRAYLRHLFVCDELLGLRLLSLHNVAFLVELTRDARAAIGRGELDRWAAAWLERYRAAGVSLSGGTEPS